MKVLTTDVILSWGDKINLLHEASRLGWFANEIALEKGLITFHNDDDTIYIWNSRYKWIAADIAINKDNLGKRFVNHREYVNLYDAFAKETIKTLLNKG